MRSSTITAVFATTALFVLPATSRTATAEAVLDGVTQEVQARDGVGDFSHATYLSNAAAPYTDSLSTANGAAAITARYDYLTGGSHLNTSFDLIRPGGSGSYGYEYAFAFFHVTVDSTYDLVGSMTVTNTGSDPGSAVVTATLYDGTPGQEEEKLHAHAEEAGTAAGTFRLGDAGPDTDFYFSGSFHGTLKAGHDYSFMQFAYAQAAPGADQGATASGYVRLEITEGTAHDGATAPLPACAYGAGALTVVTGLFRLGRRRGELG